MRASRAVITFDSSPFDEIGGGMGGEPTLILWPISHPMLMLLGLLLGLVLVLPGGTSLLAGGSLCSSIYAMRRAFFARSSASCICFISISSACIC